MDLQGRGMGLQTEPVEGTESGVLLGVGRGPARAGCGRCSRPGVQCHAFGVGGHFLPCLGEAIRTKCHSLQTRLRAGVGWGGARKAQLVCGGGGGDHHARTRVGAMPHLNPPNRHALDEVPLKGWWWWWVGGWVRGGGGGRVVLSF